MRKAIMSFITLLAISGQIFAQSPPKFNYQAVCRNSSGAIIDSQSVSIRITIHDLTAGGTELYKETHSVITNTFGLVNIEVGGGSVVSGSFAAIPWGTGAKYMQVEIDAGSGYASAGTPQLLSVPYAIYANQSGSGGTSGPTGPAGATGAAGATGPLVAGNSGQTLRHDGNTWVANDLIYNNGTSVGIGTTSPAAMLDIQSTNNGVLFPRLTTSERNAIATPPQSLIIFNTTTHCFETYIGTSWQKVFCGCDAPPSSSPAPGANFTTQNGILWNWFSVPGASGYKWNTANDYGNAIDEGPGTFFSQKALKCGTKYTTYVWAYNDCGNSSATLLIDSTESCPDICGGSAFMDLRDSTIYGIISIGTQCWMKQNLKYDQNAFGNDYKFCFDPPTCSNYEMTYDWAAAMQGGTSTNAYPSGVQGVCPLGWHMPSDSEWVVLENYLGGDSIAGGKMKDIIMWNSPNTGATNSSGFSGLPLGHCNNLGTFLDIGVNGHWWTATENDASNAWFRRLDYDNAASSRNFNNKQNGFSVRCIKD
jgi:uncharacterized protein (TIGR02145 family)